MSKRRSITGKTSGDNTPLIRLLIIIGKDARSLILTIGTLMTIAIIGVASIGLGIRPAGASGGQVLKITTPGGGTTFYLGRCFRTDLKIQTDSLNANSVDIIIPYNPTYLAPYTGSGCTTSATGINTSGLFPAYPSNTIVGNQILVTGYDPSGSSPVNTGSGPADRSLGHIFWKVLSTSGSYRLGYTYTAGSTVDTNMAESGGDGTDVLDSVQNLTLNLANDTSGPTFSNKLPTPGSTSIAITSGVSYTFSDTGAGVGTGTLTHAINGTTKSKTFAGCYRSNSNPVPSCNVTMTSIGTLQYARRYVISATGSDLAATPNTGSTSWEFTTEDDDDGPYVTNRNPDNGATGVATSSNIVFRVKDYKDQAGVIAGLGVDLSTLTVDVTPAGGSTTRYTTGSAQLTYSGSAENYLITINPSADLPQNTLITVVVNVSDLHSPSPNVMSPHTYTFTTIDSTAPSFTTFVPAQYATSIAADTNVSFHIVDGDGGAGVDIDATSAVIAGVTYTSASPEWSHTGTSSDYAVIINPSSNFRGGQVVTVALSTRDLSTTPNTATSNYTFTIASTCGTCFVDREDPARFTTTATVDNTLAFHVNDTGDGILDSSITITLIGTGAAFTSSPLILTGASTLVDITGTPADYAVLITLPASIVANVPFSLLIDATNVNGLRMASVGYTAMSYSCSSGGATSGSSCTVTSTTTTSGGRGGGTSILGALGTRDLPRIIERRTNTTTLLHDAAKTPYSDVPKGSWYEDAVSRFIAAGILDGKGMLRGNDGATRAEFAKAISLISKATLENPSTPSFVDAPKDAWFYRFVETAARLNVMLGYNHCYGTTPCYTKPGQIVSRAEAAAMIARYYKLEPKGLAPVFSDLEPYAWYLDSIAAAADRCILQGQGGSMTQLNRPNEHITRAEMVVMLDRAMRNLQYGKDCRWGE